MKIEAHCSAKGGLYAVSFKLSSQGNASKNQQTKNYQTQTWFCF